MDKEYIERGALLDEIRRIGGHGLSEWDTLGVRALVVRQPTADVVEVVRCKDCCFYKSDTGYCRENNKGYCVFDSVIKPKNHFCGYGDRKGENE